MIEQKEYTDFIKKRLEHTENLLSVKQYQINSLLQITQAINNNFTDEALFRIYESVMRVHLQVKNLVLFIEDESWKCAVNFNGDSIVELVDVEEDLLKFNKTYFLTPEDDSKFHGFEIIIPVIHKKEAVGYALLAGIHDNKEDQLDEKIKFIQTITNLVTVAIENKKLLQQQLLQQILQKDMDLARQVQEMLIPAKLPNDDDLEMAAYYKPHREIGGDYYDVVKLEDKKWLFCIADISGKGLAAGLLMSNFQANLRTLSGMHIKSLESLVHALNRKVIEIMNGEKFITMFTGILDFENMKLTYVNAGHNPSFLIQDGKMTELKSGCTVLGMMNKLPFLNLGEVDLRPGAVIINYTDGLTDVENEAEEMMEYEDLKDFIEKAYDGQNVQDLIDVILKFVNDYKGEGSFIDDISLLTCKVK